MLALRFLHLSCSIPSSTVVGECLLKTTDVVVKQLIKDNYNPPMPTDSRRTFSSQPHTHIHTHTFLHIHIATNFIQVYIGMCVCDNNHEKLLEWQR